MDPSRVDPSGPTQLSPADAVVRLGALVGSVLLGRYRLDRIVGRGGMGALFAAHDLDLERDVAVKLLLPRDQPGQTDDERFLREARMASRVRHPNIVDVFDVGMSEIGLPFLVMELLEGQTLGALMAERGRLSPAEAMTLLCPVMGALAFAHARGVLHRDLKPDNVFIARNAVGAQVPKLLDFGVAKALDDATLTRSGTVIGTPAFMSPEQAFGDPVSPSSDVWSMGVMWFLVLSGRLPFESDAVTGMLLKIVNHKAPLLGSIDASLPPRLAATIDTALRRDAARRHASMAAFARLLLDACVDGAIAFPRDPDPIGLPDWRRWCDETAARTRTLDTEAVRQEPPAPLPVSSALDVTPLLVSRPRRRSYTAALVLLVALVAMAAGWFAYARYDAELPRQRPDTAPSANVPVKSQAATPGAIPAAATKAADPAASNMNTKDSVPDTAPALQAPPSLKPEARSAPDRRRPPRPVPKATPKTRPTSDDGLNLEREWR